MPSNTPPAASPPAPPAAGASVLAPIGRSVFHAAWMAIVLGIFIELLILALATGAGTLPGVGTAAVDTLQKVSWSMIVCAGLAFGRAASKALPALTGLAGLLAAPLGFHAARSLHRGAAAALGVAAGGAAAPSPWLIAGLKAVQYGVLGVAVALFSRPPGRGLFAHAAVGLGAGLLFGGAIVVFAMQAAPGAPAAAVVARAVNEVLHPVGCAVVLYATEIFAKRVAAAPAPVPAAGAAG